MNFKMKLTSRRVCRQVNTGIKFQNLQVSKALKCRPLLNFKSNRPEAGAVEVSGREITF